MNTIINIVLFILILGLLVFVHELGHFLTAKKSGVFIHEFSIGMGPLIKTIKGKDGINYSIRALPIGGYVQMAGEIYEDDDTNTVPKEKFMCNKPWWKRIIILCAGVFNNFLLAFLILFFIALIWGSTEVSSKIGSVDEDSAAAKAGLVAGDKITKFNGKKIGSWDKLQLLLLVEDTSSYNFEITHKDGTKENVKIVPDKFVVVDDDLIKITDDHTEKDIIKENNLKKEEVVTTYKIGVTTDNKIKKGFVNSFKYAYKKFGALMSQMVLTLKYLFTGGISVNQLSGPVGIYTVVGETRKAGIENVIYLIAYLSINLGIMNILPIPALDGGHVLFLLIELITRKKINEKVEAVTTTIFFVLLMAFMGYITIHDIINLFH